VGTGIFTLCKYKVQVTDANGCSLIETVSVPTIDEPMKILSQDFSLTTALAALTGACILVLLVSLLIFLIKMPYFKSHSVVFCALIKVGAFMGYASALVLLPTPTNALCAAFPWLLGVSFTLVYGCLFLKTWWIWRIFRSAQKLQHLSMTTWYICRLLGLYFSIEVAYLVVWTVIDPPRVRYVELVDGTMELRCMVTHDIFWFVFIAYKGAWMIFGAVLAVLTRNIFSRFNESKTIAFSIYNSVVVVIVAIFLGITLENIPGVTIVVEVMAILLNFTFTVVALFLGVWLEIISTEESVFSLFSRNTRNTRKPEVESNSSTTMNSM